MPLYIKVVLFCSALMLIIQSKTLSRAAPQSVLQLCVGPRLLHSTPICKTFPQKPHLFQLHVIFVHFHGRTLAEAKSLSPHRSYPQSYSAEYERLLSWVWTWEPPKKYLYLFLPLFFACISIISPPRCNHLSFRHHALLLPFHWEHFVKIVKIHFWDSLIFFTGLSLGTSRQAPVVWEPTFFYPTVY